MNRVVKSTAYKSLVQGGMYLCITMLVLQCGNKRFSQVRGCNVATYSTQNSRKMASCFSKKATAQLVDASYKMQGGVNIVQQLYSNLWQGFPGMMRHERLLLQSGPKVVAVYFTRAVHNGAFEVPGNIILPGSGNELKFSEAEFIILDKNLKLAEVSHFIDFSVFISNLQNKPYIFQSTGLKTKQKAAISGGPVDRNIQVLSDFIFAFFHRRAFLDKLSGGINAEFYFSRKPAIGGQEVNEQARKFTEQLKVEVTEHDRLSVPGYAALDIKVQGKYKRNDIQFRQLWIAELSDGKINQLLVFGNNLVFYEDESNK